jgi:hypothetical protein
MMSSSNPMALISPAVVQTRNGSIQISSAGSNIGILVERDGTALGTLMGIKEATELSALLSSHSMKLSRLLPKRARLHEIGDR